MKGEAIVIGTMEVDGEELTGIFIECEKSELDSRVFGKEVEVIVKEEDEEV